MATCADSAHRGNDCLLSRAYKILLQESYCYRMALVWWPTCGCIINLDEPACLHVAYSMRYRSSSSCDTLRHGLVRTSIPTGRQKQDAWRRVARWREPGTYISTVRDACVVFSLVDMPRRLGSFSLSWRSHVGAGAASP